MGTLNGLNRVMHSSVLGPYFSNPTILHSVLFGINLRNEYGVISYPRAIFLELITPVFHPAPLCGHVNFALREAVFLNFYSQSITFIDLITIIPPCGALLP
jgi:hypothetical protein